MGGQTSTPTHPGQAPARAPLLRQFLLLLLLLIGRRCWAADAPLSALNGVAYLAVRSPATRLELDEVQAFTPGGSPTTLTLFSNTAVHLAAPWFHGPAFSTDGLIWDPVNVAAANGATLLDPPATIIYSLPPGAVVGSVKVYARRFITAVGLDVGAFAELRDASNAVLACLPFSGSSTCFGVQPAGAPCVDWGAVTGVWDGTWSWTSAPVGGVCVWPPNCPPALPTPPRDLDPV